MKNEHYKVIEYNGYSINIDTDDDCDSPDTWGNEDCFVVYDHRQFFVNRKGFDPREIFEQTQRTKRMFYDGCHVFTLNAYIHSGVALSLAQDQYPFTDRWDVSTTGYVIVKKEKGSFTRKQARRLAQGLVETWNEYLSGDVYGFTIESPTGEQLDSCWGYYGDSGIEQLTDECKYTIDGHIKERIAARAKQVKTFIKNHVPLEIREHKLESVHS